MKNILSVAVAVTIGCGLMAPSVKADGVGQAICGYVASDHKSRLRDQLRANKIKLKKIYSSMKCNDMSLLRFAMHNNADKAGAFMAKRISASLLSAAESDGKTVLQWASENGKDSSATVSAIKKRLKM